MRQKYIKLAERLYTTPEVITQGSQVADALKYSLMFAMRYSRGDGSFPAALLTPTAIKRAFCADALPDDYLLSGIEGAKEAGWVRVEGDTAFVTGWDDEYGSKSGAQRQREYKERKRKAGDASKSQRVTKSDEGDTSDVTPVTDRHPVTKGDVTPRHLASPSVTGDASDAYKDKDKDYNKDHNKNREPVVVGGPTTHVSNAPEGEREAGRRRSTSSTMESDDLPDWLPEVAERWRLIKGGLSLSADALSKLKTLGTKHGPDALRYAIEQASDKGDKAIGFAYVAACCETWVKSGGNPERLKPKRASDPPPPTRRARKRFNPGGDQ